MTLRQAIKQVFMLIALSLAAALSSSAQEPDVARGSADAAFTVEGWTRSVAKTGTIYYSCASKTCSDGALVSFRRQPKYIRPNADILIAVLETMNQSLVKRGVKITKNEISNVQVRKLGKFLAGSAVQEQDGPDFRRLRISRFSTIGLVSGGGKTISIFSTANDLVSSSSNFEAFVPVASQMVCYQNSKCK